MESNSSSIAAKRPHPQPLSQKWARGETAKSLDAWVRSPSPEIGGKGLGDGGQRLLSILLAIACLLLSACAGPGGRLMRYPSNEGSGLNSIHGDWSPHHSGRYIALVTERQGSQQIELFDTRSRRSVPVPGLNRLDSLVGHPSVSADGNFIAYAAIRDGRSNIYLYQRGARQSRSLTQRLRTAVRNPSLSERGDRVAFEVSVNGQWDVAIYDRQGRPLNIPTNPR